MLFQLKDKDVLAATGRGKLYLFDPMSLSSGPVATVVIATSLKSGLSGGQGNVYVPGADGTLYAFAFAIEK